MGRRRSYLGARASKIRAKHDTPGCLIAESFAIDLVVFFQEFNITTTAVTTLLELCLILNDKWFSGDSDRALEGSRDSMVGGLSLCDETLLTLNDGDDRFFDFPPADVRVSLPAYRGLLSSLRRGPTIIPIIGELLEKWSFDLGGLMLAYELPIVMKVLR